jgi:hypothetical protein
MRRIVALLASGTGIIVAACSTKADFQPDSDAGPDGQVFNGDGSGPDMGACAQGTYQAQQAPAAMLVVLQRSGSMSQNNKWVFAAQAVVQALDADVFDTMTLGLMAEPASLVTGPSCIAGTPVACGVPAFPQVDLAPATNYKSMDPTGVRHAIKGWLTANAPDSSAGEGNPMYSAIQAGIGSLQGWPKTGKRILFVVTDGGISCASLSARPAINDGNGCTDWEDPNGIMSLVAAANADATKPVETFILGVPGADDTTYDPTGVNYPPYHMRAALSSIAQAGSPANVPAGCNSTKPFRPKPADCVYTAGLPGTNACSPVDPNPATSCHFDMSQGYTAQKVADAISLVRGKVLGCIFDLPQPDGGTIDPNLVNVDYSINAGPTNALYKRKDQTNQCTTDGCWDYTVDGKVQLIGKACTDVSSSPVSKVDITVGCDTIVK